MSEERGSEGRNKGVCPRLVDYLCIVGNNTAPHRPYTVQSPELLARYPTTDHRDFPLPRDMVYFCQPDGCNFTSPRRPEARETQSFVFTLTDKDSGITRFGVCLNFYRGIERRVPPASNKRESWTRGTDRSTDSAFSSDYKSHSTLGPSDSEKEKEDRAPIKKRDEKNGFKALFEGEIVGGSQSQLGARGQDAGGGRLEGQEAGGGSGHKRRGRDSESIASGGNDSDVEVPTSRNRRRKDCGRTTASRSQSLTSICLVSSHPFFSSFRSCLATLKKLVEASASANCRWRGGPGSRGMSGRREADLVWAVLAGVGLESTSSFLLHDIREIETWILRLLSAPIPVSGRTRLELEIIDRRFGPLLIFSLPDPTRFCLCDFPLHLPLELLGVDTTLQVLTLILMECKVLLQSRDLNALSLSVLSLTNLLYPLQYMFPVIPLLPTCMLDAEQLLLAPTPYIIGLPASFLAQKKHIVVPDDAWLVDLDSGKLTCPHPSSLEDIPPLPEPEGRVLRNHLKQVLSSMSIQPITNLDLMHPDKVAALLKNTRDWEDSSMGFNPLIYGNDVDSVDIATRVAMVRFFNSPNVLANFNEHTRTLRLYPRPVVAFQTGSFIRSRPKSTQFLKNFASTQAVEFYAEWTLMPSNLAFQRIHTGVFDPTIIGDKFKWYAHNLEPVSFVVWDNLSSLNQALKSIKDTDTLATDESGSDSECGTSSSSFSSVSDLGGEGPHSLTNVVVPPTPTGQQSFPLFTDQSDPGMMSLQPNPTTSLEMFPQLGHKDTLAERRSPVSCVSGPRSPRSPRLSSSSFHSASANTQQTRPRSPSLIGNSPLTRSNSHHHQHHPPDRPLPIHPPPSSAPPFTADQTFPRQASVASQLHGSMVVGAFTGTRQPAQAIPHCTSIPTALRGRQIVSGSESQCYTPTQGSLKKVAPACMSSGLDPSTVYNPPQILQVAPPDNMVSPLTSEESHSEADSVSPVAEEVATDLHTRSDNQDKNGDDTFTSESENSSATCKTVRHFKSRKFSPTASASFGSELSLAGSEQDGGPNSTITHRVPTPLNKLTANFSVKFPRSRFSESSSSSESRKVSDSRQSSTEEVAQELFHNIEQFTKQAKKAAESLETAGKSAMQASKKKVIAKGYVKKDTIEDLEVVRKNVVDDIKTAMEKKNEILKSLNDTNDKPATSPQHYRARDTEEEIDEEKEKAEVLVRKTLQCDKIEKESRESKPAKVCAATSSTAEVSGLGHSSNQSGFGHSSNLSGFGHSSNDSPAPAKLAQNTMIHHQFETPGLSRQCSNLSSRSAMDNEVFEDSDSGAFLSYISSDLTGLANQTSDFIGGLFGRGTRSTPGSLAGSPVATPRSSISRSPRSNLQGPFPKGRRGLVEKSSLIRHPSSKSMTSSSIQSNLEQKNAITAENHAFIKEIVEQVFCGEGVGWLKMSRLKKLMEDENYRNIILTKLNKTIDRKVAPDDHVDDVCVKRSVYKGMLKIILTVIHGLEVSLANFGVGGMASAYQLLEISHTHFWTKDVLENSDHGLALPSYCTLTAPPSSTTSPMGSRDNLDRTSNNSLKVPLSPRSCDPDEQPNSLSSKEDSGESRKSSHSEKENFETSTGDMLKDLLQQKKQLFLGRIASIDSETDNESCANSETGSMITNPAFQRSRGIFSSIRSTMSDTEMDKDSNVRPDSQSSVLFPTSRGVSGDLWPCKSTITSGYRYHGGGMVTTVKTPSPDVGRYYLFEGVLTKDRAILWDNPQFWEDIFLDAVAQERELIGMDTGAEIMLERYRGLCESEKKRLEHDEDRLLSTMLFNLVAFMVMMNVNKVEIKKKVRRLLGKSHMGIIHCQEINLLLDKLQHLIANDIDLKPLLSRQVNRQSFTVHAGTDSTGDLLFLEVRDDGMVLRTVTGTIAERWFFERLVNMTYSPKNKVLCLWRRQGGQTQLHKYYTKKCKDLYYCIKGAMERAVSRGHSGVSPGMELGGEFPVQDIKSGEGGLLQVCMEGVGLLFANSKFFVRLEHIRKCFTQKDGIFVLEEFNPKTRKIVQRKYKSAMADQICYAVLCVFSYVAAGQDKKQQRVAAAGTTAVARNGRKKMTHGSSSHLTSGGISPRGPLYAGERE